MTPAHRIPSRSPAAAGASQALGQSPSPDVNPRATRSSRPSDSRCLLGQLPPSRSPPSAGPVSRARTDPEPGRPLIRTGCQRAKLCAPKRGCPRRFTLRPRRLRAAAAKRNYLSGLRGLSYASSARAGVWGWRGRGGPRSSEPTATLGRHLASVLLTAGWQPGNYTSHRA